jgi:hypothetical protein
MAHTPNDKPVELERRRGDRRTLNIPVAYERRKDDRRVLVLRKTLTPE